MKKLSFDYPFGKYGRGFAVIVSVLTSIIILVALIVMIWLQIEIMKILFVLFMLIINLTYDVLLIYSKDIWYDGSGIAIKDKEEDLFIPKEHLYKFKRRLFFFYQIYLNSAVYSKGKI